MKVCLFFVLGIAFFNAFAFGQNTKDFETLRALIREDTRAIVKEEIAASEKRTREFVSLEIAKLVVKMDEGDRRIAAELQAINTRIDDMNNRLDDTNGRFDDTNSRFNSVNSRLDLNLTLLVALSGLIGVALGLPYLQDKKKERAQEEKIATQQQQIEAQQQQLAAQQQILETQQQQLAAQQQQLEAQQQRMDTMAAELKTLKQDRMPSA